MKFKKLFLFLLSALIILGMLSGCQTKQAKQQTLWVVTEETEWDQMNDQARQLIEIFETEHPGFTVNLDILPMEETARDAYLKQIRTELMSGKGPDVFLLPTDTTEVIPKELYPGDRLIPYPPGPKQIWVIDDTDRQYPTERTVASEREPLFRDVEQTMRNGLFRDLSEYYDHDETIEKDSLNSSIMDAGTYLESRYLLPLRYDIPVLYIRTEGLAEYGLDTANVSGDIMELMEFAVASGSQELAASLDPFVLRLGRGFSLLSHPLDYDTGTVKLTQEELAAFLHTVQDLEALVGDCGDHRAPMAHDISDGPRRPVFQNGRRGGEIIGYYDQRVFPSTYPMRVGTLTDAPRVNMHAILGHEEYTMLPLRSMNGELTAYVTYYGAVGSGCRYPEEAYEFLRLFYSEDAQYEQNRPFRTDFYIRNRTKLELLEDGWPVRVKGSADGIWKITRTVIKDAQLRIRPDDNTIPPLSAPIDRVYFGCVLEQDFAQMIRSLNDQDTGEPTDVDIEKMAEEFIRTLTFHICEG